MPEYQIYRITTQKDGQFRIRVDAPEGDGIHAAVIASEDGQKETALFQFPTDAKQQPAENVHIEQVAASQETSSGFSWSELEKSVDLGFLWIPIVILTLVIMTLVANTIHLAKKVDLSEHEEKQKRYTVQALAYGIAAMCITLAAFVYFDFRSYKNIETYVLPELKKTSSQIQTFDQVREVVRLKGYMLDPIQNTGLINLELTAGDTTLRTGESGLFQFDQVDTGIGVRLNHPQLRSSYAFRYPAGEYTIPFDIDLYNLLYRILDAEAKGALGQMYEVLHPVVQSQVQQSVFIQEYPVLFEKADLPIQSVQLRNVVLYDKRKFSGLKGSFENVVEMTVIRGTKLKTYAFAKTGDSWYLVQ
ncbi:hypothetical protein H6758_01000 [Candidatus Nomurabacteria bacterium]|nr:hypothetical protein [Candidatus Nomurabacteria bacterium]